jgi:uracil-DNA glycosylase family 4
MAEAELRGVPPEDLVRHMLYSVTEVTIPTKQGPQRAKFIPGHLAEHEGQDEPYGPPLDKKTRVMVVGKMPWVIDNMKERFMAGNSGEVLASALEQWGMDYSGWYLTNLVKFKPPDGTKKVTAKFIKDCRHLLEEEIRLVDPDLLLVMGGEATKALFGRTATLSKYRGSTTTEYKGIPAVVTYLPTAILSAPDLTPSFERDIKLLVDRLNGEVQEKHEVHYEVVSDEARLAEIVDEHMDKLRFAVDCEWGGEDGSSYHKGGKLRCIQFSWAPYHGVCVELRDEELNDVFQPSPEAAYAQLRRLFCRPGVQLGGHNIPADILWLEEEAQLDCLPQFFAGVDTMQMYHLLYNNERGFGLENLSTRFTDQGRYDLAIDEWINNNVKEKYRSVYLNLFGYGRIPGDILYPYAIIDVDVVMRVWDMLANQLEAIPVERPYVMPGIFAGHEVHNMWDFYRYIEHPAVFPRYEIECEGLMADKDRFKGLVELFERRRRSLTEELQAMTNWEGYNPGSYEQNQELLFGTPPYRTAKRPETALTLKMTPVKTTEKPSRDWSRVKAEDSWAGKVQPATDVETVQILRERAVAPKQVQVLDTLLKFKFVDQVCKNFLRAPELNPFTGNYEWIKGMVSHIDRDGRIRTTLLALTDTGRYSSSKPNLQNLPKRRESELRKCFAIDEEKLLATKGWSGMSVSELKAQGLIVDEYYTIRSCFKAKPGHVLIEADYKQAELCVLAYIANDGGMKAVMDNPKRDLHSEMAVNGLNLDCTPDEVKKLYPSKRVVAKAVNFGIAYGRGANALVRSAKSEGVEIESEEAQLLIDGFFDQYPGTKDYLDACHSDVENKGYVVNAFGRRRNFSPTDDEKLLAANKREAGNMPIQGTVADALNIALFNLYRYRDAKGLHFRMALTIHDAIILEVPYYEVDIVKNEVLPVCMSAGAQVPTIGLTLGIDIEIMRRWGEKIDEAQAIEEAKSEVNW